MLGNLKEELLSEECTPFGLYDAAAASLLRERGSTAGQAEENAVNSSLRQGANYMSEPTYEELKAKLAELEQQVKGRKKGAVDFKVSEKNGYYSYYYYGGQKA